MKNLGSVGGDGFEGDDLELNNLKLSQSVIIKLLGQSSQPERKK